MPKSLEHYQQETGRAGRDGLEAECVLLYSGGDPVRLKRLLEKSAAEAGADPAFLASGLRHVDDMDRYARGAVCRHRALVEYFGQPYSVAGCNACDLCLGDTEEVDDALVVAQKILSCVARVKENFGVTHVVGVLRGENAENIRKWGHEKLSTYGLLKEHAKPAVRDWIYQLIGQGMLRQVGEEYPVLKLTEAGWEVMRGKREVRLIQLKRRQKGEGPQKSKAAEVSWEGVDRGLFEALRVLRREIAEGEGVPAYVVFGDRRLRELAQVKPTTPERMRLVYGVGEAKLAGYGEPFLKCIVAYCREHGLAVDEAPPPPAPREPRAPGPRLNAALANAFGLFRQGTVIEDAIHQLGKSRSTVMDYLGEYIRSEKPASISLWVDDAVYRRVAAAARQVGTERLKPIFLFLGEAVPYDQIRLVVTHLQAVGAPSVG
jgi:ATP-dependent DNA helicase RecQ